MERLSVSSYTTVANFLRMIRFLTHQMYTKHSQMLLNDTLFEHTAYYTNELHYNTLCNVKLLQIKITK